MRLVIESTVPKYQMRLEQHLGEDTGGLVQRIAQRLLASPSACLLNTLDGRPPNARRLDDR